MMPKYKTAEILYPTTLELIKQRKQNCYLHLNLSYRFNAVDTCGMLILSPFYPVESGAPPFQPHSGCFYLLIA